MGVYVLTILVFLIWLGYPIANLVFGLMISMHVSSIIFLLNHWLSELSLVRRLLISLAILFVVSRLIYVPAMDLMEKHLAMPLRVRDRVVVANTMPGNRSIKRGDCVAYHFTGGSGHGVRIRDGYGLDPVLGMPGDLIRFGPTHFEANGKTFTRLAHMPTKGELVVPEKQWFVWPSLDTVMQRNVAEESISEAVLNSALVTKAQLIGKPFRHWFWRRQVVP
jgi:signal peptidase I